MRNGSVALRALRIGAVGLGLLALAGCPPEDGGGGPPSTTTTSTTSTTTTTIPSGPTRHFLHRTDIPSGLPAYARAATHADLDEDGDADLVEISGVEEPQTAGTTITVMLSDGSGTLPDVRSFSSGGSAADLALGDVDGDGHVDAIVAGATAVNVLLGDGDGNFGTPIPTAFPSSRVWQIAVGDIDGDGNLDALAGDYEAANHRALVLLGHGDGTFDVSSLTPPENRARAVALDDVTGDDVLDAIVGSDSQTIVNPVPGTLSVYPGNGDGTFGAPVNTALTALAQKLRTADLNGDGDRDVVSMPYQANTGFPIIVLKNVDVLLNDGAGALQSPVTYAPVAGGYPDWIEIADMDGNGRDDLVAGSQSSVGVLLSTPSGALLPPVTYHTIDQRLTLESLTVFDLNADGRLDVVVPDGGSINTMSIFLGRGDGRLSAVSRLDDVSGDGDQLAADVNADGILDLIGRTTSSVTNQGVIVALGRGNGSFGPRTLVSGAPYGTFVVGDVTGDGKVDLIVVGSSVAPTNKDIRVFAGNGDGTFGAATIFTQPQVVKFGVLSDVDGDTDLDLVVSVPLNGTVTVLLNGGGGSFASAVASPAGTAAYDIDAGDLDGDGDADLVVTNNNATTNTVSVLLGNGDGTFAAKVAYPTGTLPSRQVVTDVDGDGALDIVTADTNSRSVSVLTGDGAGAFDPKVSYTLPCKPADVALGDFDGDGIRDLATGCDFEIDFQGLYQFPGQTGGTFGPPVFIDSSRGEWDRVQAADFDGDGGDDLMAGGHINLINTRVFLTGP